MAWERSFEARVMNVRAKELKYQKLNYHIEVIFNAIWYDPFIIGSGEACANCVFKGCISDCRRSGLLLALRCLPWSGVDTVNCVHLRKLLAAEFVPVWCSLLSLQISGMPNEPKVPERRTDLTLPSVQRVEVRLECAPRDVHQHAPGTSLWLPRLAMSGLMSRPSRSCLCAVLRSTCTARRLLPSSH